MKRKKKQSYLAQLTQTEKKMFKKKKKIFLSR